MAAMILFREKASSSCHFKLD